MSQSIPTLAAFCCLYILRTYVRNARSTFSLDSWKYFPNRNLSSIHIFVYRSLRQGLYTYFHFPQTAKKFKWRKANCRPSVLLYQVLRLYDSCMIQPVFWFWWINLHHFTICTPQSKPKYQLIDITNSWHILHFFGVKAMWLSACCGQIRTHMLNKQLLKFASQQKI